MLRETKYPEVNVQLVGEDGNAFAILGRVTEAMRQAGLSKDERDAFTAEATSGDYDHLLRTVIETVNTTGDDDADEEEWGTARELTERS